MINPISRTQYRYDNITREVHLDLTAQPNLSGSSEYSRNIDAMIRSPDTFEVKIASTVTENGSRRDVDFAYTGGVTFVGDITNPVTTIVVSGHSQSSVTAEGGGRLFQSPGEVLMHEIARHAGPRATGETPTNRTENRIRDETNRERRAPDPTHPY